MSFDFSITNTSSGSTFPLEEIIINYSDWNLVGITTNLLINPGSTAIFKCIITSITSGDENIDVYYQNTIYYNLGSISYLESTGLRLTEPLRSYQMIPAYQVRYNFEIFSNDIPAVNNVIFHILAEYAVESGDYTQSGAIIVIDGTLPTASEITSALGLTTETVKKGDTFTFIIKCEAFTEFFGTTHITGRYDINSNTGLTLDSNSNFEIDFEASDWIYGYYIAVANADSTDAYTVYSLAQNSIFTQNVVDDF